ncbi:MAG: GldG family protein [Acidobacteriia bacterium]|nr:GldG family protein [Terriglobia bacterium]
MKWSRKEWVEFAGSVGAACLIAGYLRYSVQGELLAVSKALLIAGGVLSLAAVVFGFREILNFFSKRSSQLGTNTVVLALGVMAILGLLNFLGYRHPKRFDLTSEKLFTLSDQTRNIVRGLSQDVTVVRFAKQADPALADLMAEYAHLSSHVKYQAVDPQEKPEVAKEYGAKRMGDVIVASGERKQTLEAGSLGSPSEQDITSAMLQVTRNQVKMVCFVTGHGEKSLTDSSANGYAQAEQGLHRETYATKAINLVTENGVAANCEVVVIAGPTQAFFPQEAAMVEKYLDGGGKALIEIDPETDPKLDAILQSWNVAVGNNVVVDASGVGRLFGTGPATPLVVDYGESPITRTLQKGMTFFPLARTASIADRAKTDPQSVELLKTSAQSFTIPKLEKEVKFDPKTRGPLSLGVAATRTSGGRNARLVVIGDSDFAANQWASLQQNGDLFFNAINWLAQDENLISIRPKSATNRRVALTEAQQTILRWCELIFLPGIVLLAGIVIWWKRR